MNHISLNELVLVTGNLFTPVAQAAVPARQEQRLMLLNETLSGRLYGPPLRAVYDEAVRLQKAQPEDEVERRAALAEADESQADYAHALKHLLSGIMRLPDVPEARVAAAVRVEAAFVPSLAFLQYNYTQEAALVTAHTDAKARLGAELALLGADVSAAVDGLIASEARLGQVLFSAEYETRSRAVRAQLIAAANRLRTALADEVAQNPALPRDADGLLFHEWDEAEARARQNAAARRANNTATPLKS